MNLTKILFKNKIKLMILAFFITCTFGLSFGFIYKTQMIYKPIGTEASAEAALSKSHLRIPQIKIDSMIENVGLSADGSMGSTLGPEDTGWYEKGPIPGNIGSAVIDGHSGWKDGVKAVFDNLHKLKKGDKIYIDNQNGLTVTFIVTSLKVYRWNDDTKEVFLSNDNKAHLNLITCTGNWDKVLNGKSERLVVFSEKEI